jgi:hypothetical protein
MRQGLGINPTQHVCRKPRMTEPLFLVFSPAVLILDSLWGKAPKEFTYANGDIKEVSAAMKLLEYLLPSMSFTQQWM